MSDSLRAQVLDEAKALTTGDRNNQYGPPTQDFERTAAIWTAQFGHKLKDGEKFEAHDVALAQIGLKLSRLAFYPNKQDSWTDIAGYAACGYECAEQCNGGKFIVDSQPCKAKDLRACGRFTRPRVCKDLQCHGPVATDPGDYFEP